MKSKSLLLMAMLLVAALVVRPYEGQAVSEVEKIEQELKALKKDMDRAAHNQRYAEKTVKELTGKKEATKEDIAELLGRIELVHKRLENTQAKVAVAEERLLATGRELEETTAELEEAIQQLKNREEMMDARVRLAYTTGADSYLDVLLSSTSFSDFLGRLDAVESIVKQDSDIAEQKRQYSQAVADKKVQVEDKKKQVEEELQAVKALYKEVESHKDQLVQTEKEKEVMMAKLAKEIEDMEEISEESERQLMEMAKKASELEAKKNKIKLYYKGGKLGTPLKDAYRVSSSFGYRTHPISGKRKLHAGIDMAAPKGTPVYAAETGVVIVAQSYNGYGNCIIIDHGGGLWTLYGHLMNGGILVEKGETVKRGEKIGLVGSTGQSTGNHLHFEVRKNSEATDPAPYLK